MQIQDDSTYVLDENPAALLAGAEIEAAGLFRYLKIIRLWNQSSALPRSWRDKLLEEERRIANLYAATLLESGCAFGIETADKLKVRELKVRIEAACILEPWECRPQNRDSYFPSTAMRQAAASPAAARKSVPTMETIREVNPARLAWGTSTEQKDYMNEGDIAASYSSDSIAMGQPVREPFRMDGEMSVAIGLSNGGAPAYRLCPLRIFDGNAPTTARRRQRELAEAARNDRPMASCQSNDRRARRTGVRSVRSRGPDRMRPIEERSRSSGSACAF